MRIRKWISCIDNNDFSPQYVCLFLEEINFLMERKGQFAEVRYGAQSFYHIKHNDYIIT